MIPPLIVAGLLAYILSPAVDWLQRRTHWSHKVAVNVTYFVSLAVLLAIPATIVPVLLNEAETLVIDLEDFPTQLRTFLATPLNILGFQLNLSRFLPTLSQDLSTWIAPLPGTALHFLEATSRNVLVVILVVVTVYYLLGEGQRLRDWLIRLWPEPYRKDARRLFLEIKAIWAAYLRGQLALMFILAVMYTIAWLALGLPGALILGILTGLFNIVPELGPFVAALLAMIVALVEGSYFIPLSNFWFAFLVIGVYLVLNYVKTIWLQPRIFGQNVNLPEGVVFVAIVVAILVWGVLAVLVIVPTLASAIVIGRYIRHRILGESPFPDDAGEPLPPQEDIQAPKPEV
jgi:predicted PurR-regulated permease PerM